MLQILPVYHLTGNLILSYNLLFLSSFVLSGLGMYLLVRDLLGDNARFSWPAFVAGLIFAFVPFRIAQVCAHPVGQRQWMPFALYGFRRFILHSGSTPPPTIVSGPGPMASLIRYGVADAELVVRLLPDFLRPVRAALFIVHQIVTSGRWREWRLWGAFASAAVVVIGGHLAVSRPVSRECSAYTVSSGRWARCFSSRPTCTATSTAPEALRIWGPLLQVYPKPEGELFFGVIPWVLFFIATLSLARLQPSPTTRFEPKAVRPGFSLASRGLRSILVVQLAGSDRAHLHRRVHHVCCWHPHSREQSRASRDRHRDRRRAVARLVACGARTRSGPHFASPLTFAIVLTLLAIWLSLGPRPHSLGRPLAGLGLYGVLYEHVPGFDGLRVPARYAMIAALFISIAAGYGAAVLERFVDRRGRVAMVRRCGVSRRSLFSPR